MNILHCGEQPCGTCLISKVINSLWWKSIGEEMTFKHAVREWMMGVVTDRNKTVTWHVCWIRWFRQRLWETGTTMLYWNSGLILQIWWYLLKGTARNTKWGRCRHSVNRNVPLQVQNEHARNSFPRTPRLSTAAGATASTYKCMTITFRNITHSHGGVRVL